MSDASGIADLATGGLVAREVGRATGHSSGPRAGHDETDGAGGTCADCGALRVGAFCHVCGQSGHVHRNFTALGHDIAHGVFHFEGKIWRTLPLLILHPGDLTRRYVHGQRTRFVSPMALFLFSVFLLFATVNRVSMPDFAGVGQGLAKAKVEMSSDAAKAQTKLSALKQQRAGRLAANPTSDVAQLDRKIADVSEEAASLTEAMRVLPSNVSGITLGAAGRLGDHAGIGQTFRSMNLKTGSSWMDNAINHIKENPELYAYKLKIASYKFSWALVPISVPLIWLLFCLRRDVGLYDHAILAIHSLSFMTLLVVMLLCLYMAGAPLWMLWVTLMILPPVHMYRHLKGSYLLGRFGALWRTCALLIMTTIAGSLFFALLLWLEAD